MKRRIALGLGLALAVSLATSSGADDYADSEPGATGIADIPGEFLDAPAVVLEDRHYWNVVPARRGTYRHKRRIAILDRRGFDHADQVVLYNAHDESLESFEARTVLGDGRVIEVPPDLRHEFVAFQDEDLDLRSVHFTFPGVEVGAILEWTYTLYEKDPSLIRSWDVQGELPVLWSRFRAEVKQPAAVRALEIQALSRVDDGERCEVVDERSGARASQLEMICRNVPAFREEPQAPPQADVILGYLVGWSDGALAWEFWRRKNVGMATYVEEFVRKRPKVQALATRLIDGAQSDQEKINVIYGYVKENVAIRDVYYAPRQKGKQSSFETVDQVLDAGGGLPFEVTLLTLALLREAGLETRPVLVQDRSVGRFVMEYPDPWQVDHLMLRVNVEGREALLDPSCRYCQAGMPDWRYCSPEKSGLRLGGILPVPFEIGVVPARHNSEIREQRARLASDGTLAVAGTVTWSGQYDIDLRRRWEDLSPAARAEDFGDGLPGDVRDVRVEISDPEAFFENLSARYSYVRSDLPLLADGRVLLRPADVFSERLPIPLQERRTQPVWFRYPYTVRAEVVFELPGGFDIERLPSGKQALSGPGLSFESIWRGGEAPNELVWAGLLTVDRLEIPVEEYEQARDFARELRTVLRSGIVALGRSPEEGTE